MYVETIANTQSRILNFISTNYPNVDLSPGSVIYELVAKLNASLQNPLVNMVMNMAESTTITSVLNSAVDTYSAVMDEIASNYNTVRNQGTLSTGKIKVVVSETGVYFLKSGFTFTQPVLNLNFVTTADWKATTTVEDVTSELQLFPTDPAHPSTSTYYFILPVVAASVGPNYQITDQAQFTPASGQVIPNFTVATAYGNFTSGLPLETDKQLVARFQQTLTNSTLLTKNAILSNIYNLYPNVRDISVIGASDAEMTRSKHNAFGISSLGCTDVYVRSSFGPETIQISKTATKSGDEWTMTFDYNDIPAFYRIVSVLPQDNTLTGTIALDSNTFSFSTAAVLPTNLIVTNQEGRFTKYQTATAAFRYTPTSPNETATSLDFNVILSYQPNILDIQNLFLSADRIACADYLVKAVVPCYISVDLTVFKQTGAIIDTAAIQQDIFNYINSIKFGDSLYISKLIEICHKYPIKYVDLPTVVKGIIYTPTGTLLTITSNDVLTIPTNLDLGVTPNTTLFFADYFAASDPINKVSSSIGINVI